MLFLRRKFLPIPHHKNKQHNQRQNIAHIEPCPLWEPNAFAGVGFGDEVIPAPAVAAGTEEQVYQASQGQQVVGDKEVLQVLDSAAGTQGSDAAPDIEAQHAGYGQNQNENQVHSHGFLPGPAPEVDSEADDILKYGNDGGQGREAHEHEEQSSPETASGHLVEDVWQGHKDQSGAFTRVYAEGETGRENHETCHQGHDSIQDTDIYGLAHEGAVTADIASEDSHGADAEAQGEEGLAHGCEDHIAHAIFHDLTEVRNQIEFQSCACARQGDAADTENHQDHQQEGHHHFGDALHAVLKAHVQ